MPLLTTLRFRDQVGQVSQSLVEELDQLTASISAARPVKTSEFTREVAALVYLMYLRDNGAAPTTAQLHAELSTLAGLYSTLPEEFWDGL